MDEPLLIWIRPSGLRIRPPRGKLVSVLVAFKKVELVYHPMIFHVYKRLFGRQFNSRDLPPHSILPVDTLNENDVIWVYLPNGMNRALCQITPLLFGFRDHRLAEQTETDNLRFMLVALGDCA